MCGAQAGKKGEAAEQFHEYGADQKETILLLHGGGLSWRSYREAAEKLQRGSCYPFNAFQSRVYSLYRGTEKWRIE